MEDQEEESFQERLARLIAMHDHDPRKIQLAQFLLCSAEPDKAEEVQGIYNAIVNATIYPRLSGKSRETYRIFRNNMCKTKKGVFSLVTRCAGPRDKYARPVNVSVWKDCMSSFNAAESHVVDGILTPGKKPTNLEFGWIKHGRGWTLYYEDKSRTEYEFEYKPEVKNSSLLMNVRL